MIKFWFAVSREEERRRFHERQSDSLKQWKEYTKAKESMFFRTDTADAPWTVLESDCKKRARLNAMRFALLTLPYAKIDLAAIGRLDPLLVGRAHIVLERGEREYAVTV